MQHDLSLLQVRTALLLVAVCSQVSYAEEKELDFNAYVSQDVIVPLTTPGADGARLGKAVNMNVEPPKFTDQSLVKSSGKAVSRPTVKYDYVFVDGMDESLSKQSSAKSLEVGFLFGGGTVNVSDAELTKEIRKHLYLALFDGNQVEEFGEGEFSLVEGVIPATLDITGVPQFLGLYGTHFVRRVYSGHAILIRASLSEDSSVKRSDLAAAMQAKLGPFGASGALSESYENTLKSSGVKIEARLLAKEVQSDYKHVLTDFEEISKLLNAYREKRLTFTPGPILAEVVSYIPLVLKSHPEVASLLISVPRSPGATPQRRGRIAETVFTDKFDANDIRVTLDWNSDQTKARFELTKPQAFWGKELIVYAADEKGARGKKLVHLIVNEQGNSQSGTIEAEDLKGNLIFWVRKAKRFGEHRDYLEFKLPASLFAGVHVKVSWERDS